MPTPPGFEAAVHEEFERKRALANREEDYYAEKTDAFGLKSLDRFVRYHPDPSALMHKGVSFAHNDLEGVANAMAKGNPWAVISGLNPSGPLHLGHKAVFDELLWMQANGADIYIPITNDESYVVGKSGSLADSRRIAYEQVIPSIIAFGFDAAKTHIYVDSDYPDIYNAAMDVSAKLTLNKAFGVFGFDKKEEGENPGTMFYRAAVQIAQILLPQYAEFGGPKPTLVPVGIDQHPYILLARDVAERKGFIPPAEMTLKFMWGLDGKGKMSASRPNSAVFLTDSADAARKKIKGAYTGGSVLRAHQEIHGGVPQICPVYSLRSYHFEKDTSLKDECETGRILCGPCKTRAIEDVVQYLEEHQRRRDIARGRIDEYLLRTPLRSILE
ncbi:MAG: tryptophan--tRNA ligase [Nanoarchaeota archaeon]